MARKGMLLLLIASGLLIPTSCVSAGFSGERLITSTDSSEMPYRGLIIGSYWEEWPSLGWQEIVEPKILFIGIAMYYGPEEHQYYRFEIHFFHKDYTSLYYEYFRGIKTPHFLCGYCRFLDSQSETTLCRFTGKIHGLVIRWPWDKNTYSIISLTVHGTALYFNEELGYVNQEISGLLHHAHYLDLTEFTGIKTPFYLAGTGSFSYYYH